MSSRFLGAYAICWGLALSEADAWKPGRVGDFARNAKHGNNYLLFKGPGFGV